jgi:ABC-2 type transport system permease protein
MMGFRALLRKELREQARTYRLVAVAAIFALFGILSPVTDRYTQQLVDAIGREGGGFTMTVPPPSLEGVATQLLKNLSQWGIICGLLLAMGSVAWEKERGTAAMILTKPASRAAFLGAKLVAISINLGLGVVLGCAFCYLYTALLYPTNFPIGGYLAMALLLWWMLVGFVTITLLASALTRSAVAAAGVAIVALIVFGIVGILPVVGPYMPVSLDVPAHRLMMGQNPGWLLGPLLFNVLLVPALFTLTWLAFRHQEL